MFLLTLVLVLTKAKGVEAASNAKIVWSPVENAHHYNIYYGEVDSGKYEHAVADLPANMTAYTIGGLKKNVRYVYEIKAAREDGAEFWTSGQRRLLSLSKVYGYVKPEKIATVRQYNQAIVNWNGVSGAEFYHIYYKKVGESVWTHTVRDLKSDSRRVTISYLDKVPYEYQVVAVRGDKAEFRWGPITRMKSGRMNLW